jgi:hypothetical protein
MFRLPSVVAGKHIAAAFVVAFVQRFFGNGNELAAVVGGATRFGKPTNGAGPEYVALAA